MKTIVPDDMQLSIFVGISIQYRSDLWKIAEFLNLLQLLNKSDSSFFYAFYL